MNFRNPLVLASGILGVTGAAMANIIRRGAAGVTMKSVRAEPVQGNPNPTMLGEKYYFLNAVGLPGPGIKNAISELHKFKELSNGMLIGSIFGNTVKEFGEVTAIICRDAPIDLLEIDCSCPHASELYDKPFAYDVKLMEKITKIVKGNASVPFSMKLSPNAWNIGEIAQACEAAGADAVTAVNTAFGMRISVAARRPVLANNVGGLSGPAFKPIALKAVWDVYKAVKIPIIGTGGVTTGEDAIEMLMAGARLVGVGSAFYYRGKNTMKKIAAEMEEIMQREKFHSVEELIGLAHRV